MANAEFTNFRAGDILFYGRKQGDLFDEAIADWTQSQFVHVAIALNYVQKIEALGSGVMINPINNSAVLSSWNWYTNAKPADAGRLHNALVWLAAQKGNAYSWTDNINAIIAKVETGVLLDSGSSVNCSGLATEFLAMTGGVPELQGMDYHSTTPAGLAKLLGVTPGQHK